MVNEARTLLLNCDPGGPGSEYVPPGYVPVALPPVLRRVWDVLFGPRADAAAKNFRARQLMTVLHGTALSEYVYKLDPRVTYWPTGDLSGCPQEPEGLVPLFDLVKELEPLVGGANGPEVFHTRSPEMAVFSRYWHDDPRFAYRLGGLLLAFIYSVRDLHEVGKH